MDQKWSYHSLSTNHFQNLWFWAISMSALCFCFLFLHPRMYLKMLNVCMHSYTPGQCFQSWHVNKRCLSHFTLSKMCIVICTVWISCYDFIAENSPVFALAPCAPFLTGASGLRFRFRFWFYSAPISVFRHIHTSLELSAKLWNGR